jgi:hypothetical protein
MNENILIVISVMECLLDNSDKRIKVKKHPPIDRGMFFIQVTITFTIISGSVGFNVFDFSGEPVTQHRAIP